MKTLATQSLCRPASKWQWLIFFSGTLLAGCFFLPMLHAGRGGPIILAELIREINKEMHALPAKSGDVISFYCTLLAASITPYLVGLAAACGALARVLKRDRLSSLCSVLILAVMSTYSVIMFCRTGFYVAEGGVELVREWFSFPTMGWAFLVFVGLLPWLVLAHLLISLRLGDQAWLSRVFLGNVVVFFWFAVVLLVVLYEGGDAYSGLWFSVVFSTVLLTATLGEASALTGQPCRRVLGRLLICRPVPLLNDPGRCPECGYNLYGLAEQRCPECGRAFTFEEIGATPQEMGFGGAKEDSAQEEAV